MAHLSDRLGPNLYQFTRDGFLLRHALQRSRITWQCQSRLVNLIDQFCHQLLDLGITFASQRALGIPEPNDKGKAQVDILVSSSVRAAAQALVRQLVLQEVEELFLDLEQLVEPTLAVLRKVEGVEGRPIKVARLGSKRDSHHVGRLDILARNIGVVLKAGELHGFEFPGLLLDVLRRRVFSDGHLVSVLGQPRFHFGSPRTRSSLQRFPGYFVLGQIEKKL